LVRAQVLDASLGLFETCGGDVHLPAAAASMALLTASGGTVDVFEVVGRLLVKCLIDGHAVPAVLAPSVFKFLLGAEVVAAADLEPFFPQLATILRQLGEVQFAQPGAVEQALQLRHRAEALLPHLPHLPHARALTSEERCAEFAQRLAQEVLVDSRREQLEALKAGFSAVDLSGYLPVFSPRDLICLFTSPHRPTED
jgi:hypothetical protein